VTTGSIVSASFAVQPTPHGVRGPRLRDYTAFGGILRSAIEFPDLSETTGGAPDWILRVDAGPPPECPATPLGERRVGSETYRLSAIPDGLRLEYSHAGTFDITNGGSMLVWHRTAEAQVELARAIVIGPVLALALEAAGDFCLHGSAVAIGDRAIGFLAPKHHGKSTLAVALAAAGAQFIGDDTLALRRGRPTVLRRGIGSMRLWRDAASALRVGLICDTVIPGVKITACGFPGTTATPSTLPLDAIYILDPVVESETTIAAERERMSPSAAAVSLAHHTKLPDSLVGIRAAGLRLRSAATVAATVPVYSLRIARSFAKLPFVVEQLFAWHNAASTSTDITS